LGIVICVSVAIFRQQFNTSSLGAGHRDMREYYAVCVTVEFP